MVSRTPKWRRARDKAKAKATKALRLRVRKAARLSQQKDKTRERATMIALNKTIVIPPSAIANTFQTMASFKVSSPEFNPAEAITFILNEVDENNFRLTSVTKLNQIRKEVVDALLQAVYLKHKHLKDPMQNPKPIIKDWKMPKAPNAIKHQLGQFIMRNKGVPDRFCPAKPKGFASTIDTALDQLKKNYSSFNLRKTEGTSMKHLAYKKNATFLILFRVEKHKDDFSIEKDEDGKLVYNTNQASSYLQCAVYESKHRLLNPFNNKGYAFQLGKDFMTDRALDDNRFRLLLPKLQEANLDKNKSVRGLYPYYDNTGERHTSIAAIYEVVRPHNTTVYSDLTRHQQKYENTLYAPPLVLHSDETSFKTALEYADDNHDDDETIADTLPELQLGFRNININPPNGNSE